MNCKQRVCVIGAGTAGLSALKNSLEHNFDVTCYEQGEQVGGTWVYSDKIENFTCEDEIHSSMYEGLHTNLPKEVMGFRDFEFPKEIDTSFVSSDVVLQFLVSYAQHFDLHRHIKFKHSVMRVRPRNEDWEIIVYDHVEQKYFTAYFDYVFVCNGHYTKPILPKYPGMKIYKGRQLHSHLFRKNDQFQDEKVLIIGAGPSGMDITNHIHPYARHVYLSHHLEPEPVIDFMENVTKKTDIERFTENGAIFKDGSQEEFSNVIYCTGYQYSFPFLSADCGIYVKDNSVYPLYKHVININHPTMSIIGLPYKLLPTQCFELQVLFSLKHFAGERELPNQQEMQNELEREIAERLANGIPKRHFHSMGPRQFDYYKQLSEKAGVPNVKPVIQEIMKFFGRRFIYELNTFRSRRFKIIDEENYVIY